MDGMPWSPALLDWLASDFVEHGYDLKHLIQTILTSRAYQMPSVARRAEVQARGYVVRRPEVRRLTAEQFADAIGSITGEWSVYQPRVATSGGGGRGGPPPSDPATAGVYGREWRAASSNLTRALGRPIRDQVISSRPTQASTLQALELVNGEMLTQWLSRGARRMLGELPPEPLSLYNRTVAGRNATRQRVRHRRLERDEALADCARRTDRTRRSASSRSGRRRSSSAPTARRPRSPR